MAPTDPLTGRGDRGGPPAVPALQPTDAGGVRVRSPGGARPEETLHLRNVRLHRPGEGKLDLCGLAMMGMLLFVCMLQSCKAVTCPF